MNIFEDAAHTPVAAISGRVTAILPTISQLAELISSLPEDAIPIADDEKEGYGHRFEEINEVGKALGPLFDHIGALQGAFAAWQRVRCTVAARDRDLAHVRQMREADVREARQGRKAVIA